MNIQKTILLLLLLLSLLVALPACANQNGADDDAWMSGEIVIDGKSHYARPRQNEENGEATRSDTQVDLPTLPFD